MLLVMGSLYHRGHSKRNGLRLPSSFYPECWQQAALARLLELHLALQTAMPYGVQLCIHACTTHVNQPLRDILELHLALQTVIPYGTQFCKHARAMYTPCWNKQVGPTCM